VPQPQTTDAKLILYTLKVENDKERSVSSDA